MEIHESGEDYLETILLLKQQNGFVRAIDIANELNYSKASVSRAMAILKGKELISINAENQIELTIEGYKHAIRVYEKHDFLKKFLIKIGVNEETAKVDACRMEHVISEETFNALKNISGSINIEKK